MHIEEQKSERSRGFTLIELLTVIFIIGLLAAILIPAVSKVREKAKIGAAEADLRSVATALGAYQIDNGSLPPRAGCPMAYFVNAQINNEFPSPEYEMHELWKSYLARCELIGKDVRGSFYDRFSRSEDVNGNQRVQVPYGSPGEAMAEDQPWQQMVNPSTGIVDTIAGVEMFREPNGVIDRGQVPYQYFPVNSNNISKFRQILSVMVQRNEDTVNADRAYTIAELTNPSGELGIEMQGLTLPAQRYDRYVLFSLGPQASDQNIIPRNGNADYPDDLRLRAYYRATRDLNNNQIFDFNFRDRSKRLETDPLPDGSVGYGVMIFSGP